MTRWRLLELEVHDAFTNMALDDAAVTARIKGLVPNTLRFYQWKPSAVSVGRFQDVFKEAHVGNCRKHGVDIVRRTSGGGTIYHDSESEITYSIIAKEEDLGTLDVVEAYNIISNGLIEAAKILGISADFNPGDQKNCPNVAVHGKKISGSAQFHKGGVILQHGTFLLDVDLERMFTYLRVPWAKGIADVVCVARERLTSVKHELGAVILKDQACIALVKGFEKALNLQLRKGAFTDFELKLAQDLRRARFSTSQWNFGVGTKTED